jgi:hypothetical protein
LAFALHGNVPIGDPATEAVAVALVCVENGGFKIVVSSSRPPGRADNSEMAVAARSSPYGVWAPTKMRQTDKSHHAERNIIDWADENNALIIGIAASREICTRCGDELLKLINESGTELMSTTIQQEVYNITSTKITCGW